MHRLPAMAHHLLEQNGKLTRWPLPRRFFSGPDRGHRHAGAPRSGPTRPGINVNAWPRLARTRPTLLHGGIAHALQRRDRPGTEGSINLPLSRDSSEPRELVQAECISRYACDKLFASARPAAIWAWRLTPLSIALNEAVMILAAMPAPNSDAPPSTRISI